MRIALFTLKSYASTTAVRQFVAKRSQQIVLVGLSDPYRRAAGGATGQLIRHVRRSGWRIVPYLAVNFALPDMVEKLGRMLPLGKSPQAEPLEQFCRGRGIPVAAIDEVNGAATHEALRASGAELIVSFHFDQIFNDATLSVVPLGGINVHPSLLPMHRGPLPTLYALLERQAALGVTVHRLVEEIDAGDILMQAGIARIERVSAVGAAKRLHEEGVRLLEAVLDRMEAGDLAGRTVATLPYCPFPNGALLREAARRGVALVGWRDLLGALGLGRRFMDFAGPR